MRVGNGGMVCSGDSQLAMANKQSLCFVKKKVVDIQLYIFKPEFTEEELHQ